MEQSAKEQVKKRKKDIRAAGGKKALQAAERAERIRKNKAKNGGVDRFQLTGITALAAMLSLALVVLVLLFLAVRSFIRYTNCCSKSESARKTVTYNAV